jgi:hypothetical protein
MLAEAPSRSARFREDGASLQRKGGKPAPCVNVFMGVDLAPPAFIPRQATLLQKFFFTFIRPGGNKIEAGQVIQDKGK